MMLQKYNLGLSTPKAQSSAQTASTAAALALVAEGSHMHISRSNTYPHSVEGGIIHTSQCVTAVATQQKHTCCDGVSLANEYVYVLSSVIKPEQKARRWSNFILLILSTCIIAHFAISSNIPSTMLFPLLCS